MNKTKGKGGVYAGIAVAVTGLLMMLLPPISGGDLMAWGFAVMTLGLLAFAVGVTVLLLYLRRRKVLKRMIEGREVLARWTYDADSWRALQKDEIESSKGMPVFGAIIGLIFVVIGILFFIGNPDDMGPMLAIMAGIGILIAFVAWLATKLRKRAVLKDPGEAVIARGGVYFQGFLYDWNNVTSWFDLAKLETKGKHDSLVISYRYVAGRYARVHRGTVTIPVPEGREQEAKSAANKLNVQPY